MTTTGSTDLNLDPRREEWTKEGRRGYLSVHLSVGSRRSESWTERSVKGGTWVSTVGQVGREGPSQLAGVRSQVTHLTPHWAAAAVLGP